jgi:hypothetical protein
MIHDELSRELAADIRWVIFQIYAFLLFYWRLVVGRGFNGKNNTF